MASREKILFEDIFKITAMDVGGKKFDKVSRIEGESEQLDFDLALDVNTEIYELKIGNKFTLALALTLSLDGAPDEGQFDQSGRKSLMDKFEYVMYGKIYKIDDDKGKTATKVHVFASFGGLLMKLSGDTNQVSMFQLDQRLYILLRKVG